MKGTTVDGFCRLGASHLYNTSTRFGAQITLRIKAMKMDEYLRYLGTQTASRQIFLLNFAADFHSFEILYKMLRAAAVSGTSLVNLMLAFCHQYSSPVTH